MTSCLNSGSAASSSARSKLLPGIVSSNADQHSQKRPRGQPNTATSTSLSGPGGRPPLTIEPNSTTIRKPRFCATFDRRSRSICNPGKGADSRDEVQAPSPVADLASCLFAETVAQAPEMFSASFVSVSSVSLEGMPTRSWFLSHELHESAPRPEDSSPPFLGLPANLN